MIIEYHYAPSKRVGENLAIYHDGVLQRFANTGEYHSAFDNFLLSRKMGVLKLVRIQEHGHEMFFGHLGTVYIYKEQ